MTTPNLPSQRQQLMRLTLHKPNYTFLSAREREVAIPSGDEHHIIAEVLPLDFRFLEDDNIGFEYVEHGLYSMSISAVTAHHSEMDRSRHTAKERLDLHGS